MNILNFIDMNYILVQPSELVGKFDCQYAERMPDGRVILPISVIKVVTGINCQIVDLDTLKQMQLADNAVESGQPEQVESTGEESDNAAEEAASEEPDNEAIV